MDGFIRPPNQPHNLTDMNDMKVSLPTRAYSYSSCGFSNMHCPKCGTCLRELEYEGAIIHTCDGCGSELLGSEALGHIVECREEHFSQDMVNTLADHQPIFGVPDTETDRFLNCPSCTHAMQVMNYGGDSGIMVDRCEECNVIFLDHDELEKIQVVMEEWADNGPEMIKAIAGKLEQARRETAEASSNSFAGSRFAFVNAVINRFLDAA